MADKPSPSPDRPNEEAKLAREVEVKASRKLRARSERDVGIWLSLSLFGLVGWSVALPTLAATALGIWLDKKWPHGQLSWTLTMLAAGVVLGCANAWSALNKERRRK